MKPTGCSQCGEKVLPHWTVCPVCANPVSISESSAEILASESQFQSTKQIHCVQCKAIVPPDAQICSGCHVLIVRRYCSGCSRLIPDQAELCPYCDTPASAKKSRLRLFAQPALIFAVPLCIIATFIFVLYRFSHKAPEPTPAIRVKPREAEPPPVATIVPSGMEQKAIDAQNEIPEKKATDEPISMNDVEYVATVVEDSGDKEVDVEPVEPVAEPHVVQEESHSGSETGEELNWSARGARLKQGRKLTKHASLLMQKGRYSDATIVLRNAISSFPPKTQDLSYGEALYKLGICLRKKGAPEQAIPVLQQALRFPYYRSKALREVEAATNQLRKVSRVSG